MRKYRWLGIVGVALLSSTSLGASPYVLQQKNVKQQNAYIQERRIIDVPGYYPSAVGIDVLSSGAPYFYGKVADATVEAQKQKQLDSLAFEVQSLRKEVEFLKQLVLSLQGNGIPVQPDGGASLKSQVAQLLTEKGCADCHSKSEPRGGLAIFNEQGSLWVSRKDGDSWKENTISDWLDIYTATEKGSMPKDGTPLTVAQTDIIMKYIKTELTQGD